MAEENTNKGAGETTDEQAPSAEETTTAQDAGPEGANAASDTPQPPQDVAEPKQKEASEGAQDDAVAKPEKKLGRGAIIAIAAVVVIAIIIAIVAGVSCSGPSYKLDRDKSIRTEWGATVQFKIDKSWEELWSFDNDDSSDIAFSGGSEKSHTYVSVEIENTGSRLYKYDSSSTYGDWLDIQEKYGSSGSNDPDYAYSVDDYSIGQIGTVETDGDEFRVYKERYTITYDDSTYAKYKENEPDSKQTNTREMYYAVLKDGKHDMEVSANNEKLLKDFLSTMKISW